MAAQKGSLVLIKIGDNGNPEVFSSIGGLRLSQMTLNNQRLDSSHRESGSWRQLMGNAGIQSLTISGAGIFVDSAAEETVRQYAFSASVRNYQFCFPNGDYVAGPFHITAYERGGEHDEVESYAITLSSAGTITFTSA